MGRYGADPTRFSSKSACAMTEKKYSQQSEFWSRVRIRLTEDNYETNIYRRYHYS